MKEKDMEALIAEHEAEKSQLNSRIAELEALANQLQAKADEERQSTEKVFNALDVIVSEYKNKQQQQQNILDAKQAELDEMEESVEQYIKEKEGFIDEIKQLRIKSEKYDNLNLGIDRIRMTAQSDAYKLMEEAQTQAMDTIYVMDEIAGRIADMRIELMSLTPKDEEIEKMIFSFSDTLNNSLKKLFAVKEEFYKRNNVPMEENDLYDIITPVIREIPKAKAKTKSTTKTTSKTKTAKKKGQ